MRKQVRLYLVPISILLIMALLSALFPGHFHLHHADEQISMEHRHVIDVHTVGDIDEHVHHDDAHVFKLSHDGLFKQLNGPYLPLALFLSFLFLPRHRTLRIFSRSSNEQSLRKRFTSRFTPPLRAPPAH